MRDKVFISLKILVMQNETKISVIISLTLPPVPLPELCDRKSCLTIKQRMEKHFVCFYSNNHKSVQKMLEQLLLHSSTISFLTYLTRFKISIISNQ